MYSQLLTFIIALLLFSIQEPGRESLRPPVETLSMGLAAFASYALLCYWSFRVLLRKFRRGAPISAVSLRFHKIQGRLTILALGMLAFDVYVLDIKFYFQSIPGFQRFFTISGIVGLALYLFHLVVVWFCAYPVHKELYRTTTRRTNFIRGHLSFFSALLVPWFFIALVSDLLQFVKLPGIFQSEPGQIVLFGVIFFLFLCFSPYAIVRFWHCEPLPRSPLRDDLEDFCRQRGFQLRDFLLWPFYGGDLLTAAVLGILPRLRYILITRGLLNLLTPDELKAVVSHEMGHVKRLHAVFYISLFIGYAVLSYAFQEIILLLLLKQERVLGWALSSKPTDHTLFALAYSLPILGMLILYFRYLFGYFMRNCERQADLYALQVLGHPFTLVSSLQKIAFHSGEIEDLPSWHHFSIRQRIQMLLAAHENPALIREHNRKLLRNAVLFFCVLALATYAGLSFQKSSTMRQWRLEVRMTMLEKELHLKPDSPDLYMAYSGFLLEKKDYAQAALLLEKALTFAPNHPGVLNNLAWLYATSPDPYFKPKRALRLALRAATIKPVPYILDTLAEAYAANKRYREALLTIRLAIAQKPRNLKYYLGQEQRFRKLMAENPNEGD